jgi:hypothetical protein
VTEIVPVSPIASATSRNAGVALLRAVVVRFAMTLLLPHSLQRIPVDWLRAPPAATAINSSREYYGLVAPIQLHALACCDSISEHPETRVRRQRPWP